MTARYVFEVIQDGMIVAGGDCADEATALREAGHYAMIYGQDGPVKVTVRIDIAAPDDLLEDEDGDQ